MPRLLLIDPLTLLGRELLRCLGSDESISEVSYLHTDDAGEHQIAELRGQPALVTPVSGSDDLTGFDAVLVATDTASALVEHVARFFDLEPTALVIDVGRLEPLRSRTTPATATLPAGASAERHLRMAHPALVALRAVVDALEHLDPVAASVLAVEPVSTFGPSAVEALARQAARRLQGVEVEEAIAGHVRAFNAIAVSADELVEEAGEVLPGLDITASRVLGGNFHGNLAHIGLQLAGPVSENELVEALAAARGLAPTDYPLALDRVTDTDLIALSPPQLSPTGSQVAITAMMDGLRIGGAVTALELLASLL